MRKLYILELAAALWLCMAGSVSAEILHMGMRGAAVESLQNDLVEAGYLARTVDGDYGSTTVKAVSEFQKDHGLPVTGKADDSTQAKLKEDDGKGYRDGGGIVYAQGNRGDMIAELQDRLAAAGYLTGASDGIYGSGTAAAVEQFQKDHRLPVSGAVDEQTLSLLGGGETGEAKKENKKEIKKEQKNKKTCIIQKVTAGVRSKHYRISSAARGIWTGKQTAFTVTTQKAPCAHCRKNMVYPLQEMWMMLRGNCSAG